MATTARGIEYPVNGDTLTPLASVFAALASSADAAIDDAVTGLESDVSTGIIPAVADATARDAKYPSPVAGNRVYRLDLSMEQVYRGGAWKNQPTRFIGALVYKNVAQSVAAGPTAITWNNTAAEYDTSSFYSTSNNTRLTIPYNGLYDIDMQIINNSGTAAISAVDLLYKNSSASGHGTVTAEVGASGDGAGVAAKFRAVFTAADYIEIRPTVSGPTGSWTNSGSACRFGIQYLGEL